ncbi:hypothetical protein CPB84DRAFT_1748933 [Gymnopilus junonius]|uniref:Uncharacterized protein n=1 Tax=Gymnopilus junonius TaxID=109634 RepID=A0A9P5NJZ0_GYMJU|nr:hypothetical protein CPB84DRAFT_1748933 [Gymnopilus junonius]
MDIASTVYSLTVGIVNFISEHEDKDALHDQISSIVVQIQSVVAPLMLHDIADEPLKQVLQSLQHVLSTVDGHLRSWRRAVRDECLQRYRPRKGIQPAFAGRSRPSTDGQHIKEVETQARPLLKKLERDDGASQFWRSCVGSDRLLLRLDENNTGHVTLKTLQDLVRDDDMKKVVNLYMAVWISDDLRINKPKVAVAQKKGVCVVQLSSTKTAKAWLKVNKSILKKHDTSGDLRFISDQARRELNDRGEVFNNRKAGEHITEFIRNEGFKAPILIFTTKRNIHTTRYVNLYPMTGSIGSNYKRFNQFVSALAERKTDDKDWLGFDRAAKTTKVDRGLLRY